MILNRCSGNRLNDQDANAALMQLRTLQVQVTLLMNPTNNVQQRLKMQCRDFFFRLKNYDQVS